MVGASGRFEVLQHLGVTVLGAIVDVLHDVGARLIQNLVLHVERGPEGSASVVRRRLHVDVLEIGPVKNHAVGNAVQRDAAGQANGLLPGLPLNVVQ